MGSGEPPLKSTVIAGRPHSPWVGQKCSPGVVASREPQGRRRGTRGDGRFQRGKWAKKKRLLKEENRGGSGHQGGNTAGLTLEKKNGAAASRCNRGGGIKAPQNHHPGEKNWGKSEKVQGWRVPKNGRNATWGIIRGGRKKKKRARLPVQETRWPPSEPSDEFRDLGKAGSKVKGDLGWILGRC